MKKAVDFYISLCNSINNNDSYNHEELYRSDIIIQLTDFARRYPIKDWYVSYKAALVLYGIVETTNDIDLCGTSELCDEFITNGFRHCPAPFGGERITVTNDIEIFVDNDFDFKKLNSIDGINVASIDDIESVYKKMNREKDQETLRKISEYKLKIT